MSNTESKVSTHGIELTKLLPPYPDEYIIHMMDDEWTIASGTKEDIVAFCKAVLAWDRLNDT
jgi:hypothetical protein